MSATSLARAGAAGEVDQGATLFFTLEPASSITDLTVRPRPPE